MKIIIFNSSLERLHLEAFVEREDVQIVHIQTAMTSDNYLGVVHYVTILYRELGEKEACFDGAGSPLSEDLR